MTRPEKNPFQPGAGRIPPWRAGHKEAATYLVDRLEDIRHKDGGDTVVLFGPRGNGKTALLGELREKAKTAGVRVIALKPGEMADGSVTLAGLMAAETAGVWPAIREAGISILNFGARVMFGRPQKTTAGNVLRRYSRRPLLLMVDEAHEMPVGFGKILLKAAQDCVNERFPLLVVLAGTPGLPAHLRNMHASFVERCTKLRIGRLETDKAAEDALVKPATDSGMSIDEDALGALVRESQRYPFFVQQLGFESWGAARARGGARRITLDDANKGIAAVEEKLQTFYDERRVEIGKRSVLAEAEAVSKTVFDRGRDPRLTTSELMAAVEGAAAPNGRNPSESLRHLVHLGLVWKTPELDWEPGIPSLCTFLVKWEGSPAE